MAYEQHTHAAEPNVARCAVVTLSDTRTPETDTSGRRIKDLLTEAGHRVVHYGVVRDEPALFEPLLSSLLVFNVGIEAVQIAIIAVVFPLLVLLRRRSAGLAVAMGGLVAAGVAVMGLVWFVQRMPGVA